MSVTTRIFTGADGHQLVASVEGEGYPVLLLHGGGQTRHAWRKTGHDLAQAGFQAIRLDQRGHGDSPWDEAGRYRFHDYARDAEAVARILAAEHHKTPIAIGASLGGLAALLAQDHAPDLFAALVLVDVVPSMNEEGLKKVRDFMRAHLADGFASVEDAAAAIATYLPHRPPPRSLEGLRKNLRQRADGRLHWHWDPQFQLGAHGIESGRAQSLLDAQEAARRLHIPCLLVRGLESELVGEAEAKAFLRLVPHAEWADVAGAAHMVAGDRNDAFGDALLAFLTHRFKS
jgi:pimeloyl-ACP methyl ester carboxylesterase